MRKAIASVAALGLALATAGCSHAPEYELDNRSGRDVAVEMPQPAGEPRKFAPAPAGKITPGLSPSILTFRAGDCFYDYGRRQMGYASARIQDNGWPGAPSAINRVRLEPDFTLRLFNLTPEGKEGAEVLSNGWPAKPEVECTKAG